jgi:hypothetical protein
MLLHHRQRPAHGVRGTGHEVGVMPTVEANGNDPISPLSVAAEPALCLVSKERQLGRRRRYACRLKNSVPASGPRGRP